MDAHPNPRNHAEPDLILSTPLPKPSAVAASSAARSLTTDAASPFEPLCSASGPRNPELHSKKKTILLCDWWLLSAPEAHEGRRLSVSGVVAEQNKGPCRHPGEKSGSKFLFSPWLCKLTASVKSVFISAFRCLCILHQLPEKTKINSRKRQKAVRVFKSAPITKRYDSFSLGAADGITLRIQGVINKARSHQNGIPLEVCSLFLNGFPSNWDNYADACFEEKFNPASIPESAASANQSKRGRKKQQSPPSVCRAYKKDRSLHSSGRAIWRPSYDYTYPLTRDTAKKLSIASPESLNLKRSRSGRLLVPPITEWCQKIIYAAGDMHQLAFQAQPNITHCLCIGLFLCCLTYVFYLSPSGSPNLNGEIMGITGEGPENFACIESQLEPPKKRKRLV